MTDVQANPQSERAVSCFDLYVVALGLVEEQWCDQSLSARSATNSQISGENHSNGWSVPLTS